MLLSAVSFLVVAQSSSEVPEGLMNNPVYYTLYNKSVADSRRVFSTAVIYIYTYIHFFFTFATV